MAGIINKIGETLHIGGQKKEGETHAVDQHHGVDQHGVAAGHHGTTTDYKGETHGQAVAGGYAGHGGDHRPDQHHGEDQHKEGFLEKIKDKIHGDDDKVGEGVEKKKKKDRKKREDGHEHGHDSSSSDSD